MNAVEIEEAVSELGEVPFDADLIKLNPNASISRKYAKHLPVWPLILFHRKPHLRQKRSIKP